MTDARVVLLVDDEPRMLSALKRTLRREGWAIETAVNGSEALARLGCDPAVGVIVSDFKMPGRTGIELLTEVRTRYPATGRILLSGWTSEIPSGKLAGAGLSAVLAKPWDDAELKAAIRGAMTVSGAS